MRIYTIGFTQKTAQQFFKLLADHGVERVIDVRLRPGGQLAGFAKQEDLIYFLKRLNGCDYVHLPELAPTKEILKDYRESGDWKQYVRRFELLMDNRNVPESLPRSLFEENQCCLLCSEAEADQCHRRLIAERLAREWRDAEVVHL